MKLRAPVGTASFSYGGVETFVDADGTVDVDGEAVDALISLGFAHAVTLEMMTKAELIDRLIAYGRAKLEAMSIEDLRSNYAGASASEQKVADAAEIDPATVTPDQVDAMSRSELFAFLRQKGVAAGAVSNDMLKSIAKNALADEVQTAEDARLADELAAKDKADADAKSALDAAAKAAADAKMKANEDAAKVKATPAPQAAQSESQKS